MDLQAAQAAVLGLPAINGLLTNVSLAADLGDFHSGFLLLQGPSDLLRGVAFGISHVEYSYSLV